MQTRSTLQILLDKGYQIDQSCSIVGDGRFEIILTKDDVVVRLLTE